MIFRQQSFLHKLFYFIHSVVFSVKVKICIIVKKMYFYLKRFYFERWKAGDNIFAQWVCASVFAHYQNMPLTTGQFLKKHLESNLRMSNILIYSFDKV